MNAPSIAPRARNARHTSNRQNTDWKQHLRLYLFRHRTSADPPAAEYRQARDEMDREVGMTASLVNTFAPDRLERVDQPAEECPLARLNKVDQTA